MDSNSITTEAASASASNAATNPHAPSTELQPSPTFRPSNTRPVISIIGLGKLGSPMAACFAQAGFRTIGVDTNPHCVAAINAGDAPVEETDLKEVIQRGQSNLTATTDLRSAIMESSVTFVIVPTPSEADGSFSLKYILPVCKAIGAALREKSGPHTVCISSTVMPGSTGGAIQKMLEIASGRTIGKSLGLCYSPEFIALGSVIRDFLNPDFLLIGESDTLAGNILESLYRQTTQNRPVFARMNFVNAEVAKIAVNSFVTMKITYGNMLAGICQRIESADVDVVTQAIGLDSRIGRKYLKGAVGFGGPCFPRDNVALAQAAMQVGAQADLARTVDAANQLEVQRLTQTVLKRIKHLSPEDSDHLTVGILGLSYKPNTDVVEKSQGVLLAQSLTRKGIDVIAYDPAAMTNAATALGESVRMCETLDHCTRDANVLVIMTPWDEFATLPESLDRATGSIILRRCVIDCWRIVNQKLLNPAYIEYHGIGVGPVPDEDALPTVTTMVTSNSDSHRPDQDVSQVPAVKVISNML